MGIPTHDTYAVLQPFFQKRLCLDEPLAHHCAFGVGGPADVWITLEKQQEVLDLVNVCTQHQWPLLLIGSGRNILFADAGVRGIVARIDFHHYQLELESKTSALLVVEAGARWSDLLNELLPLGWSGLEFGIGIPGTLGAGIVCNAGAHNQDVGHLLEWVKVLDARACSPLDEGLSPPPIKRRYIRDELDLGYQYSRFRAARSVEMNREGNLAFPSRRLIEPAEIVLLLGLRLHYRDPQQMRAQCDHYLYERRSHEPPLPYTGPIFKDLPGIRAGALIERVGLQGYISGHAQITEQNANYLANLGGARAEDMAQLIILAHQQVRKQCDIDLALNIDLLGEWPLIRSRETY